MKRILLFICVVVFLFSLCGCGNNATHETESTNSSVNNPAENETVETIGDEIPNGTEATTESNDVIEDSTTDTAEDERTPNEIVSEFADEQLGSNSVMIKEKLGRNFGAVSSGDNFGSHFNENYLYAEMSFEDNEKNNYVMARMMRATENTEAIDIFADARLGWENAVDEVICGDVTAKVLRATADEGDFIGAYWLDTDDNMVYGIVVLGETLVLDYVGELFYSAES